MLPPLGVETGRQVSRKYSLGSSVDLVKSQLSLRIHTILWLHETRGNEREAVLGSIPVSVSLPAGEAEEGSVPSERSAPPPA